MMPRWFWKVTSVWLALMVVIITLHTAVYQLAYFTGHGGASYNSGVPLAYFFVLVCCADYAFRRAKEEQ